MIFRYFSHMPLLSAYAFKIPNNPDRYVWFFPLWYHTLCVNVEFLGHILAPTGETLYLGFET